MNKQTYIFLIKKQIFAHSTQIKQINPSTNEITLYKSYAEIHQKLGIQNRTINTAIKNKTLCYGAYWEFVNKYSLKGP